MKHRLTLLLSLPFTICITLFYTLSRCLSGVSFHGWTNVLLWCTLGAGLLLSIWLGISGSKQKETFVNVAQWQNSLRITALVCGCICFIGGALNFFNGLQMLLSAKSATPSPIFFILLGFLLVVGGVYICLCPTPNSTTQTRDALFGMALPIASIIRVLDLYFETSTPKNASAKLFISLTYLLLALYWLSDLRLTLGRANVGYHKTLIPLVTMICGGVAVGECLSALILKTSLTYGGLDLLFFVISFLLINIKGCFAFQTPENEVLDIE